MNPTEKMLAANKAWSTRQRESDPAYFERLAAEHRPQFLYIGCSDARMPVDALTQTVPGEMFIHRNIANLVVPTDANLLAVVTYAVQALGVKDIVVVGHERCGGVKAALGAPAPAPVEQWVTNIRMVARLHDEELAVLPDDDARWRRLVELNVMEQVTNLSRMQVIRDAWKAGAELRIHGWVYGMHDGLLREVVAPVDGHAATAVRRETARPAGAVTPRRAPAAEPAASAG